MALLRRLISSGEGSTRPANISERVRGATPAAAATSYARFPEKATSAFNSRPDTVFPLNNESGTLYVDSVPHGARENKG
jgi:hypothetical protein